MNVLHLSTSDLDGGAARSAYRLHQGLQSINTPSEMLVRVKHSADTAVLDDKSLLTKLGPLSSEMPLQVYPDRTASMFSSQWLPDTIASRVRHRNPDIINLHWLGTGFLQIETLAKLRKPIVWTFHDMWAFTGGCHYTETCDRYQASCGRCPQLKSQKELDLSRWIWQRKAKAWQDLDLVVVTPSDWMAKCAQSSSLLRNVPVKVIPYGLDTQRYKPIDRSLVRKVLNLPQDKHLILFSAVSPGDPRKGFHLLQKALQKLSETEWKDQIELVILGGFGAKQQLDLNFAAHYLGKLSDDISLALVYAAVDVFTAPSIEDNLPNTVLESLACGTPCVAFKTGGMPDMIEHHRNGYLAQPYEVDDLVRGISWVLEDKEKYQKLCDRAREKVEQEFTLELQAQRYRSLYCQLLAP